MILAEGDIFLMYQWAKFFAES